MSVHKERGDTLVLSLDLLKVPFQVLSGGGVSPSQNRTGGISLRPDQGENQPSRRASACYSTGDTHLAISLQEDFLVYLDTLLLLLSDMATQTRILVSESQSTMIVIYIYCNVTEFFRHHCKYPNMNSSRPAD